MVVTIKVTQDFIDQREYRGTIYGRGKRTQQQLLRDIECEILEWHFISTGKWEDDDRWEIDGHTPDMGAVDVKMIWAWYNVSRGKLRNLLKQRDLVDNFLFAEWVDRPKDLLVDGDVIEVNILGAVPYWKVLDSLLISFAGKNPEGFYVDARKLLGLKK